jgi:hypothetical protein
MDFAMENYGRTALEAAWDDFCLGASESFSDALDGHSQDMESLFLPWFTYNWVPPREELSLPLLYHFKHFSPELIGTRSEEEVLFELLPLRVANSPFGFHQVVSLDPQRGRVLLRDLFLGIEQEVKDRQGSQSFQIGTLLFGKVVSFPDQESTTLLMGCSCHPIPIRFLNEILNLRKRVQGRRKKITPKLMLRKEDQIRRFFLDIREVLQNPAPPILTNTEGHRLLMMSLRFELKTTLAEAAEKLQPLYGYSLEELLEDATRNSAGEIVELEFPWLKLDGGRPNAAAGNTVLGNIRLTPGRLEIQVNSKEREQKIREEIAARLGDRARFKQAVIESPESPKFIKGRSSAREQEALDAEHAELMKNPEVRAQVQAMTDRHWEQWVDTPLPALEGMTPREASRSGGRSRELLMSLLLDFEGKSGEYPESMQILVPDVPALRRKLGL